MKLGLLATAAVFALVGGLMVSQVAAQGPEISIGDGEAVPGGDATVDLTANVPDGLGAWTVDITYDPDVVDASDCQEEAGSVCNANFAADTVRVTGASASGLDTETVLASITFTCGDSEGSSDLSIALSVFSDATIGNPQDISGDTTISDGSITCAEAQPTVAAATNTPVIVPSGYGPSSDGGSFSWVIAALAGAGLAALAGFGALRVRSR